MLNAQQLNALETLIKTIAEEIAVYSQIVANYNEQVRKHSFTDMSYYAMQVWDELIKEEIESLTTLITDLQQHGSFSLSFLQQHDALKANLKIIAQAEKLNNAINYEKNINPFSTADKELVNKINELRQARLNSLEKFQQAFVPHDANSPFAGYKFKGIKMGGANFSGEYGGWYIGKDSQQVLIKKEAAVEKVIGEYLAGSVLNTIYQHLGVAKEYYAAVDLIRPRYVDDNKKSNDDVYLLSVGIPHYAGDLWDYAWPDDIPKPTKRPPGLLHPKSLTWTDEFISQFKLEEEFAKLAGPRLLLGDFGLHNGNFGVALDDKGFPHIVALDYGAAFYHFIALLAPFAPFNGLTDFYKNHFLDYGNHIIASEFMANVFIKIGNMDSEEFSKALQPALNKIYHFYDTEALRAFCKRLGILPSSLNRAAVQSAIMQKIAERQQALKEQGYALLLEHCISIDGFGNPHAIENKLATALKNYGQDLKKFIEEKFSQYPLVYHKGLIGPASYVVDRPIPILSNIVREVRRHIDNNIKDVILNTDKTPSIWTHIKSFVIRNLEATVSVGYGGAIAGMFFALYAITGSALVIGSLGFLAGALAGIVIALVTCAVLELIRYCNTPKKPEDAGLSSTAQVLSVAKPSNIPKPEPAQQAAVVSEVVSAPPKPNSISLVDELRDDDLRRDSLLSM